MKLSVIASLIVGVHVAVIGLVALQGCSTTGNRIDTTPTVAEPPPVPAMPPTVVSVPATPAKPVAFPEIKAPVSPAAPAPAKSDADNIYVIKPGDMLSKIAKAHGVKTSELQELNKIADPNKIRVGQKIILPDHASPSLSKPEAAKPAASSLAASTSFCAFVAPAAKAGEHIVKSGECLSKIAAAHGVKTKALMEANGITDPNKIRIGQKLIIPGADAPKADKPAAEKPAADKPAAPAEKSAPATAPAASEIPLDSLPANKTAAEKPAVSSAPAASTSTAPAEQDNYLDYTVQQDDTVESIASIFVVSAADIRAINNISGSDIKPGTVIRIPPGKF